MEDIVESSYEKFFISHNNIILKANKHFLDLTGYTEIELVGKTLLEVSKILRIDSQIRLQDIKSDAIIFIFTKELVAVKGTISCQAIGNSDQKVFSFKTDPFSCVNQNFNWTSQLAQSRGDAVVILDFDSLVILNNNDNHLNFLNPPYHKKTNTIGRKISEILPEPIYLLFNKMKNYVVSTGNPFYAEEVALNVGSLGETYWNITLVAMAENLKFTYLMLYLSNETEKVLNREALTQRNKELETIIKNISDEIRIFDKDFKIDSYNEESSLLDEDDQLIPYEELPFQRVARGESVSGYFTKRVTESGISYKEVFGYPIYDKKGEFTRGIMIYRDVEDRIEREEARLIKTQKELLTKVVDSMGLEYMRCSYPDLKIISINDKGINKLKQINTNIKSSNYPIGENCFEIYSVDAEKKRKDLEFHLIENGEYSYVDYISYTICGEERFFKTIIEPILGLKSKIVEIIFITMDITDEVKATRKMEETLEMQAQMFATISHELKTPLNLISTATQLIELDLREDVNNINKEDIRKSTRIITQNCYRFTKLINNIIDLSRMESGFYKVNYNNRNIIGVVEDIVDSIRTYVENAGLYLIFDTEIEEKIMAVDVGKLERILLNLISNAVKFSHKGERIYVDIKVQNDFVLILVRDCGLGIDQKHLDTIFDTYKKVDNSLFRNAEGSGIGLSLVRTMVNLIGGEISVESEIGKGSVFTVKLPTNILDESEIITPSLEPPNNTIEQLNIEFSDIYSN